ncbi:hypothetical protein V1512DRAFT_264966 [Lipomyces arxii]|uniref:uncharacterized protein n=1 Tax=Lipomyces arxii TaxID=56418 RepID=UPI0034CFC49E
MRKCVANQIKVQASSWRVLSRQLHVNATSTVPDSSISPTTQKSFTADDALLRDVFDSKQTWQMFSRTKRTSTPGLLSNPELQRAENLVKFAQESLTSAKKITNRILSLEPSELHTVVRLFDRLSDILCRVIDLAEFVRTEHPDPQYVNASEHAFEIMTSYMIQLNSNDGLYHKLRNAMDTPSVASTFSREEIVVAKLLLYDFERSGAALDDSVRDKVISVQHDISQLSREFVTGIVPENETVSVKTSDLMGLDPMAVSALRQQTLDTQSSRFGRSAGKIDTVQVPTTGSLARMALLSVHSPKVREMLYIESRKSKQTQVRTLEKLLMSRMKLANLMGASSYAEYQLSDKMAHTPTAVNEFLTNLADTVRPAAEAEIDLMRGSRGSSLTVPFQAWDRDYYMTKYLESARPRVRANDFLHAYFSLGVVMQGLSRLFTRLYGIRFVPCETAANETWHEDVRKIEIMSDTGGEFGSEQRVGIVYCDLFSRSGKPKAAAHYTVRCSRRIFPEEIHDEMDPAIVNVPNVISNTGDLYQVPTIALVCDFAMRSDNRMTLLSFAEVETLFHEMGHAMHSMLGRTELHNISGTRCAADFVELPSVLMEHFASDPNVLSLYARHYETDEPLPPQLLQSYLAERAAFKANDTYTQIEMSMLDHKLHSLTPEDMRKNVDSASVYYDLQEKYSLFPPVQDASWVGKFGHLVGYGAVYYGYLLDRAIASQVWTKVFKSGENSLSRESGETFKNKVLVWGGGRDPWDCLAEVLDRTELRGGGPQAMEFVARGSDRI